MHYTDRGTNGHRFFFSAAVGLAVLFSPFLAHAAALHFSPSNAELKIGQEITVEVRIDSEGETINGVQATIVFPAERLEPISLNKENSVFNFWLEEPNTSTKGKIKFIAGTTAPASGGSLRVLRVVFKAKGIGFSILAFEDSAVTGNDGAGTNVLGKVGNATVKVVPEFATLPAPTSTEKEPPSLPSSAGELVPPPVVTRPPLPSEKFPAKPRLRVELYPDETKWYRTRAPFLVRWDVPSDVSAVATALNEDPRFIPPPRSEILTEGKLVQALSDGIWFYHARFRNNVGWGESAHYKISIDTDPPVPFPLDVREGKASDDPTPTIVFKTADALSGVDYYAVRVDGGEGVEVAGNEFTPPPLLPGKHTVTVSAADRAGNIREASLGLEVIPLPSPSITFMTPFLTLDTGEGFVMKGRGEARMTIHVEILDRRGQIVAKGKTAVLDDGEWIFGLEKNLRKGEYSTTVWMEDERGAVSLPLQGGALVVKPRPAVKLGILELSWAQVVFLLVVLGGVAAYWFERQRMLRRIRYGLVEYDFYKMIHLMEKSAGELERKVAAGSDLETFKREFAYWMKSFSETIGKIKTYFPREVEKLKE